MELKKILEKMKILILKAILILIKTSGETFWEDVFNKLEYKNVLCENSFIQYEYY